MGYPRSLNYYRFNEAVGLFSLPGPTEGQPPVSSRNHRPKHINILDYVTVC